MNSSSSGSSSGSSPCCRLAIFPNGPVDVPADWNSVQISMGVYLPEDDSRSSKAPLLVPAGIGTVVLWRILDGADSGTLSNTQSVVEDFTGTVITALTIGAKQTGATYTVEGRVSVLVDGERICHCGQNGPSKVCAPLTVVPGQAASIVFDTPKATLPADKTSDVTITLTARDRHNNLVADGAPVSWQGGGLGDITAIDDETTDGRARAMITAGFLEGDETVEVQVDSFEASFTIPNNPIHVTVASEAAQLSVAASRDSSIPTATTITAHCVDTSGVPVADGVEVTFFASNGSWENSSFGAVARVPASGGRAAAILNAEGFRPGSTLVAAGVTNFAGCMRLPFVMPVRCVSVTTDKGVISGDASADGTIPIEQLDDPIRSTPYYTSATATIAGGMPNAKVTIKLSGAGARLVELPAGNSVTLDSQGNATFAIKSKGNFIPGAEPQDLLIAVSQGALTVQTPVKIVSKKWYALLRDFASTFDWGDPLGSAATAEDFATGMLCAGSNIGDVAMQIPNWATGQRATYTKMGYAATGIMMELFAGRSL